MNKWEWTQSGYGFEERYFFNAVMEGAVQKTE